MISIVQGSLSQQQRNVTDNIHFALFIKRAEASGLSHQNIWHFKNYNLNFQALETLN